MNMGDDIKFKKGDRIAQCIPAAVGMNEIAMVAGDEAVKSDRGENGFGSTGINNNVKENNAGVK